MSVMGAEQWVIALNVAGEACLLPSCSLPVTKIQQKDCQCGS